MNYDLTRNELAAAMTLVKSCLRNMGGIRPLDLDGDPYTWVCPEDLIAGGWTRHEAAGTFGALAAKGFIDEMEESEWAMTTEAYRWLDTKWERNPIVLIDY